MGELSGPTGIDDLSLLYSPHEVAIMLDRPNSPHRWITLRWTFRSEELRNKEAATSCPARSILRWAQVQLQLTQGSIEAVLSPMAMTALFGKIMVENVSAVDERRQNLKVMPRTAYILHIGTLSMSH